MIAITQSPMIAKPNAGGTRNGGRAGVVISIYKKPVILSLSQDQFGLSSQATKTKLILRQAQDDRIYLKALSRLPKDLSVT
jgi:hypothetical protein